MTSYHQQVDAVLHELATALHSVDATALDTLCDAITGAPRIFVAGKGRSGLVMRAFAMRLMHLGLTAHVIDEVTTPAVEARDLLIIGSGSGATPTLVRYAERARALGARLALLSAAPASPIAALADLLLVIAAASPKAAGTTPSIQPMANLFEQSLLLVVDIVTTRLMETRGLTTAAMMTRHANLE